MPKNGRIYELLENRQLENNVEIGEKNTKNTYYITVTGITQGL